MEFEEHCHQNRDYSIKHVRSLDSDVLSKLLLVLRLNTVVIGV